MWYFTWILGLTAALAIGVINVMWYEAYDSFGEKDNGNQNVNSDTPSQNRDKAF